LRKLVADLVVNEMICDIFWFLLNVPSMYKEYIELEALEKWLIHIA
jgi:hypothetical protein